MDTNPESTLLSADYRAPTISDDLSNTLVRSESKEQFRSEKHVSNISITQLLDADVIELNPPEARFQKIKSGSCQIITISDSDDFDIDEILSCDAVHSNDETVPLELELSLLDYDLEDSMSPRISSTSSTETISIVSDLSSSASGSSPSSTSGNMDPNNNFSHMNQMLTNFDDTLLSLEEKAESEAEIKVQPRLKFSPERNGTKGGHGFSCAYPNKKIFNGSPSSTEGILTNDHQNSSPSNVIMKSNTLAVNCNSFDDSNSVKDGTIDDHSISRKLVPSESPHKSEQKSKDLSYKILLEISNILKDCNDNILDPDSDQEILSLEPVEIQGNDKVVPVKTDLSNSLLDLKKHLKENYSPDTYSDPSSLQPCLASKSPGGSSLTFQSDLTDQDCQSIQKNNSCSCPLLKGKNSPHFVPSSDFGKRVTGNEISKHIPHALIVKTTPDGDMIKVLNDDTVSSSQENPVSPHVKSCRMGKQEVLKRRLQFDVKAEPGKCFKHEDCESIDLADVFRKEEANVSAAIETPLDLSWDSSAIKSKSLSGRSLTDRNNIRKDNPKNLPKSSNPEAIDFTCRDSELSAGDGQLEDCQNKTTQKTYQSVKERLKNKPENKSSRVGNWCRNSTDKVVLTSSFGEATLTMNESQQHSAENELKKKQPEGCLDNTSKGSSLRSLGKLMFENTPLIISVNTDGGNQKRIVTLGKQLQRGENSLVTLKNKQDLVKSPSNDDNQLVTVGNQSDKKMHIKTTPDFDKTPTKLPLNEYVLNDSKDMPKDSNMIIGKMPTDVSLIAKSQVTEGKTSIKRFATKSESVSQRNTVTPVGVKKRKRAKNSSVKKRAKTLLSLSKKEGFSSQAFVASVDANNASTDFMRETRSAEASSGKIPKAGSNRSSYPYEQTSTKDAATVSTEDASSKRKFVKAKRGLHKQKQQATCLNESEVKNRLQWVCRRWNVETLSNQDINLTTAAYIRRQLPAQEAGCFQGCLEGQKDYTLAIVAPNRKRRLPHDDSNIAEDNASKKRRLSKEVQLIPANIKDLPPDRKLFGNKIIEMLAASQTMSLVALERQRNQELNLFNEQYQYLQYQLKEKQFQERQYYNYYQLYNQQEVRSRLQYEHHYQKQQFDMSMCSRYNDLMNKFTEKANERHTLYKTSVEKLKSDLSTDESDSGYLTIALRMGPTRKSSYKTTYRNVCLTPQVALAMIREDEIYDSFYSHKSE